MKSNLLALMSVLVGFTSGSLIIYKLLNRRRTSGSFRELYKDNAEALKKDKDESPKGGDLK